jgi:hypothetical protein
MEKRVRDTSIDVYNRIRAAGLLSERRWQVYDILFREGPLTGAQVAERMRDLYGIRGFSESVRNRLTELRDMHCVRELGETTDPLTRSTVILWDVTSALPVPLPHREKSIDKFSYNQALEDLDAMIHRLWLIPPKEVIEAIKLVRKPA